MGHGLHAAEPAVGAYVWPATHGIWAEEPAGQALPAGHVIGLPEGQYVPAGHGVHAAADVAPALDVFPGGQFVHDEEFAGEYVPIPHNPM